MAAQKKPVIHPASRFESITPALVIACIMTGAWFVAGWSLFGYYGGPSGFAALSPAEVGLVVCGGLLPLMVIWLLCGMMIVGTRMRNAMMTELSALRTVNIMPEETQSHIRSITRAFEDRVEHLQGVTSGILASLDRATGHYEYQSEVLETLSGRVHEQTTELSTTLQDQTEQVTAAEARIDRMVNRMKHAMDDVREAGEGFRANLVAPIEEVQETLGKANSRINDQIDAIWSRLELLDAAQSETEEASIRTREVLEGESRNLREAANEALGNVETMSGKLESQIGLLKSVSEDANGVADQMQNRLEEQSSALAKAGDDLAAHAEDLHRAIEAQVSHLGHLQSSVEGYGDVISREFEQKVETLMNAAREAADIVGEHTARATRQAIEELSENGDRLTGNIGVVSDRARTTRWRVPQRRRPPAAGHHAVGSGNPQGQRAGRGRDPDRGHQGGRETLRRARRCLGGNAGGSGRARRGAAGNGDRRRRQRLRPRRRIGGSPCAAAGQGLAGPLRRRRWRLQHRAAADRCRGPADS